MNSNEEQVTPAIQVEAGCAQKLRATQTQGQGVWSLPETSLAAEGAASQKKGS